MDDSYGSASADAWWFRWHPAAKPGRWIVTISAGSFFCDNFDAVVDDFGNLVRVS